MAMVLSDSSKHYDAANGFARVHQVERLVDVVERHRVGDQVVDVDLALHVPVDDLRHVSAAACAAECRALPHSTGHQLERTRLDALTRPPHAASPRHPPP